MPIVDWIRLLGRSIPEADVVADYTTALAWAGVLAASLLLWPVRSSDRRALLVLWAAKILVTLVLMLFYESRYDSLDAYNYVRQAAPGAFRWSGFEIANGTSNITHLVWLHSQLLPHAYHLIKVSFAMIGLVGIYLLSRAWVVFIGHEHPAALYSLGLYPSMLFWSSILGKEPIVLLGIGLYALGIVGWLRDQRGRWLLPLLAGILLVEFVRLWMGLVAILPVTAVGVMVGRGVGTRLLILAGGLAASAAVVWAMLGVFNADSLAEIPRIVDHISRAFAVGGSAQVPPADLTRLDRFLVFLPLGMFTALFRPLPGEVTHIFGLAAGLENLVLLSLTVFALTRLRLAYFRDPVVLWGVLFVGTWTILYALISYQNLGAAARFKMQILPVLLGVIAAVLVRRPIIARAAIP